MNNPMYLVYSRFVELARVQQANAVRWTPCTVDAQRFPRIVSVVTNFTVSIGGLVEPEISTVVGSLRLNQGSVEDSQCGVAS